MPHSPLTRQAHHALDQRNAPDKPPPVRAEPVEARAQGWQALRQAQGERGRTGTEPMEPPRMNHPTPFGLSLSKPRRKAAKPFNKLRANGGEPAQHPVEPTRMNHTAPFGLSLSKPGHVFANSPSAASSPTVYLPPVTIQAFLPPALDTSAQAAINFIPTRFTTTTTPRRHTL
jgi:hypothetical protein